MLAQGQGLRPPHPKGFVIDGNDAVFIQDGTIHFGPVGGSEGYYSNELEDILDSMGVKVEHQRLVMTISSACPNSACNTPEEFLRWFQESEEHLLRRKAESEITRLEADTAKAQLTLQNLKTDLAAKKQVAGGPTSK